MKKTRLTAAACIVLAAVFLAGCAYAPDETTSAGPPTAGAVRFLNARPEQDKQWRELAKIYSRETGIPISVSTVAPGAYDEDLEIGLNKRDPLTLFEVSSPAALARWKDRCYDLFGSELYASLSSDAYALKDGGAVLALPCGIASYGILVNQTLLGQAGYTADEIRSFSDLARIAEDITARREELGFAAFASTGAEGPDGQSYAACLANLPLYYELADAGGTKAALQGTYLPQLKAFWDLYAANAVYTGAQLRSRTIADAEEEMRRGEAVFFPGGTQEFSILTEDGGLAEGDLTILPFYIGVGDEASQGLCTGSEAYWCVNAGASEEDIQATLDFLTWCLGPETGAQALSGEADAMPSGNTGMGLALPYRGTEPPSNPLVQAELDLTAAGKVPVGWAFLAMPGEDWASGFGAALNAYAAGTDSWDSVVSAFVDGWAALSDPG